MKTVMSDKRWATEYPELGTEPVPIKPCISPQYFALERERIFRRAWLNVGRVEEIPQAGDYLVRDLAVCKTSVLVVRGKDGVIRGFHNMCSHRGNTLVWDGKGSCRGVLTCRFHGWSYNSEGQLVGVPDEGNFFDLKTSEHGLTPVATDVWEGFIFINLDPQPEESLKEYLGEVTEQLDGYPFDKLTFGYGYKGELNCNWKISVDSQQEGYHAVWLHRRTIGDLCASKENPFMHALAFKFYGPHRMLSLPGYGHKPTPAEALSHRFGWTIKRRESSFLDPNRLPPGVNPTRSPEWFFDIYLIFPNFWLAVFDGAYQTHNFWPLAADRMYQEIKMHVVPPENAGERFSLEFAKCLNRDVWLEDFSTLEATQSVLASGAKTHFILKDEEILIRHFYKVLEDWIKVP